MINKSKKSFQALPAKISQPRINKCFQWQRLFDVIDSYGNKPLVWISGPPGCGKTMLIASYLKARKLDHVWYRVDSRDVDPATLFYYLEMSIKGQVEDQGKSLPVFSPENLKDPSIFCKNYFETFFSLSKTTPVLVFDNCQKLHDPQFSKIIEYMATQLTQGGRIFLISRSQPPSNFARMMLHQEMSLLRGENFQLTSAELQNLSAELQSTALTQTQADKICEITMGWVAAVVVLLNTPDIIGKIDESETPPLPELLFEYFAGEVFAQLDENTKNLLLKTAWLPKISAGMAQKLTGHDQAPLILHQLSRKNFFAIQHTQGQQILYQYHPLFKEFLKRQARTSLPRKTLISLKCHAASLLIEEQRYAEAVQLFRLSEQWCKLGDLICEQAEYLIAHGRYNTLRRNISSLPEDMLEKNPWLKYWQGASYLPIAPGKSKAYFEKALVLFEGRQNIDGCFFALSGILKAIHYQQSDFRELDHWFNEVQNLKDSYPEERSIEIEAQLAIGLLTDFSSRAIQSPHFDTWMKQAENLWFRVPKINTRLKLASILLDHSSRAGNLIQCKQLIDTLNEMLQKSDPDSNASLIAQIQIALFYWHHGENTMAKQQCKKIMKDIQDSGIHYRDCMIWTIEAASSLGMGDLEEANDFIEKIGQKLAGREPNLDTVFYYCLLGWRALRSDEFDSAIEVFSKAAKIAEAIGAVGPLVYCRHGLANALFAGDNIRDARKSLSKAMANIAAQKMPSSQYQLLLSKAYFAIQMGHQPEGLASLQQALALGRKHGYLQTPWWGPDTMEYLCTQALSNNIEVDWVSKLIHTAGLKPGNNPTEKENWPWSFKIYTLGRFTLEKDGKPLVFSTKAPKKQLDMIKAIIALGGRDVSKVAVIDALWPDAEGDKATRAFGTTLHRLRRLLGNGRAVQIHAAKISLDPKYCWVDCWDFERLISQAEEVSIQGNANQAGDFLEKAIDLYKGPFLSQDDLMPWMVSQKDRLKNTFLLAIERLCSDLESSGCYERAVSWYNRALAVEDFPEELYQRLMLCLIKLERKTEAVSIYRQCKKNLEINFGTGPLQETEEIYRSILNCN